MFWIFFTIILIITILSVLIWVLPWLIWINNQQSNTKTAIYKNKLFWATFWVVLVITPTLSFLVYINLDTWSTQERIYLTGDTTNNALSAEDGDATIQIRTMMNALENRLEENPDDQDGWLMLMRSQIVIGDYGIAENTINDIQNRFPDIQAANLYTNAAELSIQQNGGNILPWSEAMIDKALEISPENSKAMFMKGFALIQNNEFEQAIIQWENTLKNLPEDQADQIKLVNDAINETRTFIENNQ